MADHLMHTYNRLPVTFVRGEGAWLWDEQDKQYLDALTGVAVCSLGHCHPAVTEAICSQAGTLVHTSNWYGIAHQTRLADELCQVSGMKKAFFSNSGAEANEAAIKLARRFGHGKNIETPSIIVTEGSFHGRTMATLSATGNRKIQAGFEPLVSGFVRVPYDDLDAIQRVAEVNKEVVAIMVEPVLGEGGIVIPQAGYLKGLRKICDDNGWLLILDEIQTGMCRSGKWFAFQYENIKPDVVTLAKALGNGMPVGCCLARGEAAEVFQPGNHGTTFGGNPLACRVGLAVVETMKQTDLAKQADETGKYLLKALNKNFADNDHVSGIRGLGMLLALDLDRDCPEIMKLALEEGLLVNVTAGNTIRMLPPLNLTREEADTLADRLKAAVDRFLSA